MHKYQHWNQAKEVRTLFLTRERPLILTTNLRLGCGGVILSLSQSSEELVQGSGVGGHSRAKELSRLLLLLGRTKLQQGTTADHLMNKLLQFTTRHLLTLCREGGRREEREREGRFQVGKSDNT